MNAQETQNRPAARTLAEQLKAWHEFKERRIAYAFETHEKRNGSGEWTDVDTALEVDKMCGRKRGL